MGWNVEPVLRLDLTQLKLGGVFLLVLKDLYRRGNPWASIHLGVTDMRVMAGFRHGEMNFDKEIIGVFKDYYKALKDIEEFDIEAAQTVAVELTKAYATLSGLHLLGEVGIEHGLGQIIKESTARLSEILDRDV